MFSLPAPPEGSPPEGSMMPAFHIMESPVPRTSVQHSNNYEEKYMLLQSWGYMLVSQRRETK